MATGLFQEPKVPTFAPDLPEWIAQFHSGQYRNQGSLPAGSVLVVGGAQSGAQIADELYRVGRRVYLSVGTAGRVPRRYRGKDIVDWMNLLGLLDMTLDELPSPKAKFAPNPHVTGRHGGRSLNLHQFARDGVTLLGHLRDVSDGSIALAPDLHASLAKVDKFDADLTASIDRYIASERLDPGLLRGHDPGQVRGFVGRGVGWQQDRRL